MFSKKDIIYTLLIFIISFLLTSDLFFRAGQPITFDGPTHITSIAQFYIGLSQGQFPVSWADGFANYGMPIPLIAQQTTNYLGALLTFLTHDVLLSYNLVMFIGAFLACFFFYIFLKLYVSEELAFLSVFLFNFSSYRILNIYIRGALPEFFAAAFIPLSLIGLYYLSKKRLRLGLALVITATSLTILTHPFMFVISLFFIIPYAIFLWTQKRNLSLLLHTAVAMICGVGITAAYMLPLTTEIKYFNYGNGYDSFVTNQFLGFKSYFDPNWYYYYRNDVAVRGNFIQSGLLETIIVLVGVLFSAILLFKRKVKTNMLLVLATIVALIVIFLTTKYSDIVYHYIKPLRGIQHTWRFLGVFIFLPPIILSTLVAKTKYKYIIVLLFIVLISIIRFPQLYGKNYTLRPQSDYFFTSVNLHGNILNTVWTAKTDEYPVKKIKYDVIDGQGKVTKAEVKNGYRDYQIQANTNIRMADYTFYFPGWRVYIDNHKVPIQYQDPNYRGVITYDVPQGNHHVVLKFEQTKERIIGEGISIVFLLSSAFLVYFLPKIKKF